MNAKRPAGDLPDVLQGRTGLLLPEYKCPLYDVVHGHQYNVDRYLDEYIVNIRKYEIKPIDRAC